MSKAKVFITSLALGASLFILPAPSLANTYYTVNQGDNLWKISRMYSTTVEKIMSLNGLGSSTIHPGQKLLVVPDGSNNAVNQTSQSSQAGTASQANTVQPVSRSGDRIDEILDYSRSFIGVPYVSAGGSPSGFDCSGYTKYVFAHFGIDLPRTAGEQYNAGQVLSASEAKPGDLVAFKTGSYITHVGIYLGNDKFISATSGKGVAIASVYGSYWKDHLLGYSRIIPS
ncbi:LysM peptidoglycan-binding domain-containing C40 family peptidase [Desulfoscipio gibsoniae]|uniref:Cell wall-associated hydrolase, invasion-associated protein n=1 Tax=Desulfoscipio gibsoniae DSM 7213 TaxID=767817 RepID=R4KRZ4_9FIRM|nr:LysM peptidoglycan-binding domain-containing C40 family peptidase [Desulfoscipio gibsoniae]AGL03355.1 cell wall-associated hydrolase, invasion-associated protein [Desulfoscipio gibsoniae DSM 7213]